MALLCQPGAEPIAGYQLIQRLGSGGYGEVWKATAPGGLTKAIKIVYGHMQEARAEQELKALGRIKEVRHPFILSLERFEIIDNQLVIVMELADKSLMDRFRECRLSGLAGIPRPEMLGYLVDAGRFRGRPPTSWPPSTAAAPRCSIRCPCTIDRPLPVPCPRSPNSVSRPAGRWFRVC